MNAKSEFTVASWEQFNLDEMPGRYPLMRVCAVFDAAGEIAGKLHVAYLMHHTRYDEKNPHDAEARYTGYIVFDGSVGQKRGTFAMEDNGVYMDSSPRSSLTIIDCSGTGELAGITGAGRYYAENDKMVIELDYSIK